MITNINEEANWQLLKNINKSKKNCCRIYHLYRIKERVENETQTSPYTVTEVQNNAILCACKDNVTDAYNFRNITPLEELR